MSPRLDRVRAMPAHGCGLISPPIQILAGEAVTRHQLVHKTSRRCCWSYRPPGSLFGFPVTVPGFGPLLLLFEVWLRPGSVILSGSKPIRN